MKQQMKLGWAALLAACCVGAACVQSDDARDEFCQNADPGRQQEICRPVDGGTKPDGGTLPTDCRVASDCQVPAGLCVETGECVDGRCVYPVKQDGAPCNGTPPVSCRESTGTCKSGTCDYTVKTSGLCDDSNACTDDDTCNVSGACVGTARVCNAPPSQCHEPAGTCANGDCSYAPKARNISCNDGNACTVNDVCDGAGTCGGMTLSCNSAPSPCHEWVGTCSNNACDYRLKAVNSSCNDGNPCTTADSCNSSGTCAGAPLDCNIPPSPCQEWAGTCSNNACDYRPRPAGTSCNDGSMCTIGDSCDGSGQCIAGESDPCIPPSTCCDYLGCSPSTGCIYANRCGTGNICEVSAQ